MYGLGKEEYKSLEPYIKISSDYQPASSLISETEKSSTPKDSLRYPVKLSVGEHIALNTADTTMLKRVPGIGSGYARAIVNYRNRLGGYVDVNQLLDIKGIPSEALQYIVLGNSDVKKLDVNHLSLNQLKQHPYLNFYQARALVESRRLHGPLRSAADLRLISDFTENRHQKTNSIPAVLKSVTFVSLICKHTRKNRLYMPKIRKKVAFTILIA